MHTSIRTDSTVPLVGGAAVVIAFAFSRLVPDGAVPRPVGAVGPSLLILGGYIVTARGLRGRMGLMGENRLAKSALVAAGVAGVLASLPGLVPFPGLPTAVYPSEGTTDFTPVVVTVTALNLITLVFLIVAAISIRGSNNAVRSTETGLRILAGALLVLTATLFVLTVLGNDGETASTVLTWVGRA